MTPHHNYSPTSSTFPLFEQLASDHSNHQHTLLASRGMSYRTLLLLCGAASPGDALLKRLNDAEIATAENVRLLLHRNPSTTAA